MNYSETYFKLDTEEATHCDHCHLICCMYIKGHVEIVDTNDQSNANVYCVCYVVCQQCWHTQRKLLRWLLKKVMGRNALEILMPSVNSVNIYSNDGMVKKPPVWAFQNFLQIENRLNIKKVMGRNVWMCFVSTVSTYIALNALEILVLYQQYQHI